MKPGDVAEVKQLMTRLAAKIRELETKQPIGEHASRHFGSSRTAAVRRTSMDLTRALARLRSSDRRRPG